MTTAICGHVARLALPLQQHHSCVLACPVFCREKDSGAEGRVLLVGLGFSAVCCCCGRAGGSAES